MTYSFVLDIHYAPTDEPHHKATDACPHDFQLAPFRVKSGVGIRNQQLGRTRVRSRSPVRGTGSGTGTCRARVEGQGHSRCHEKDDADVKEKLKTQAREQARWGREVLKR